MKIDRGVTLHPHLLFTVKSLINFQICYLRKTKIANTKIMKICSQTKVRLLNANIESQNFHMTQTEEILKNCKTGPLRSNGVFTWDTMYYINKL